MPERVSVTVPEIVCGVAVTMVPLAGDETLTNGGVLSSLTVTEAVAVLAAMSVTVPERTWLAVSVETTTGVGHVSGAVPPAQVKVTVTLEWFHPAALGSGLSEVVMFGVVGGPG